MFRTHDCHFFRKKTPLFSYNRLVPFTMPATKSSIGAINYGATKKEDESLNLILQIFAILLN